MCLRFVGLSPDQLSLLDIAIAYLFAYPFALFPFSGIGVVDALIVAGLVEAGGLSVEAPAVAGLIVWRVFTVGLPVLMGLGALVFWRRTLPPGDEAVPGR
jgi:putative heme transporter